MNLKNVTFEGEIDTIPAFCFAGCMALNELILPEGIRKIDNDTFSTARN
ncbi:MAG: leucine-rich repeat protein [Muribaculaceae bacterium]